MIMIYGRTIWIILIAKLAQPLMRLESRDRLTESTAAHLARRTLASD